MHEDCLWQCPERRQSVPTHNLNLSFDPSALIRASRMRGVGPRDMSYLETFGAVEAQQALLVELHWIVAALFLGTREADDARYARSPHRFSPRVNDDSCFVGRCQLSLLTESGGGIATGAVLPRYRGKSVPEIHVFSGVTWVPERLRRRV
jgi:hypothetical protein